MTKTSTYKIIELLDNSVKRGLTSEPVQHKFLKDYKEQHCSFTDDEKRTIREWLAEHHRTLRAIDYPLETFSFLGESGPRRTCSLFSMIEYMLSSGDSPEYVSQTSGKIEAIIESLEPPLE